MRRPLRSDAARELANLAIEIGDPGRMARARKLHRAGVVGEIEVTTGTVSTTVFDDDESCRTSISLSLPLRADDDVPTATAISDTDCSCSDSGSVCHHVLATVLALAEQVEAQPSMLARWTGGAEDSADSFDHGFTTEQAEFLIGARDRSATPPDLRPLQPSSLPEGHENVLVVEGTDAWPVFADALELLIETPPGH